MTNPVAANPLTGSSVRLMMKSPTAADTAAAVQYCHRRSWFTTMVAGLTHYFATHQKRNFKRRFSGGAIEESLTQTRVINQPISTQYLLKRRRQEDISNVGYIIVLLMPVHDVPTWIRIIYGPLKDYQKIYFVLKVLLYRKKGCIQIQSRFRRPHHLADEERTDKIVHVQKIYNHR